MYDPDKMPQDLRIAYHTLDLIVESCYRNEPFISDEDGWSICLNFMEK